MNYNNFSRYKKIDFSTLTPEEHIEKLKFIISLFILYGDDESFKKIILKDDTDYTFMLLRDMKGNGLI